MTTDDHDKPPRYKPKLKDSPKIRSLYWCDFPKDAHLPEFWKRRPVIVVATDRTLHGAVTVIPCSSQDQAGNKWAYKLTTTIEGPWVDSWAICDKPTTVAVSRLTPDKSGKRRLPQEEFTYSRQSRSCMTERKPEPKRIAKLRHEIVKAIPRFPNDKSSKQRLECESLSGLLIHYLSWRIRFVVARPRTVHVEDTASTDPRWITLAPEITILLDKVRRGDDLTPHLSLAAWTEGYTPAASGQGPNVDRWADKDFLLNVMGFHHFHLNSTLEKRGFTTRSNNVLFAAVSRDRFDVIGIFDHSVFDDDDPLAMPAERERLWTLHHAWITRGLEPGSAVLLGNVSTSGHKTEVVLRAQNYARLIADIDPKLDDATFLKDILYGPAGIQPPRRPKLNWAFRGLDLGIWDDTTQTFFLLAKGPN